LIAPRFTKKKIFYPTSFLVILILFFLARTVFKQNQPEIKPNGMIDVSNVDFAKEVIDLNGPWEFYWNKFYFPLDFKGSHPPTPDGYSQGLKPWNNLEINGKKLGSDGYSTYRLRLRLPDDIPELGIRLSFQITSFKVFVNKKEIAASGIPGTNAKNTTPSRDGSIAYFQPGSQDLEIILHVANYYFYRGGLRGFIQLGSKEVLEKKQNTGLVLDLIMAGFGISIWLYHLFLFLQRPEERSILYFLLLAGSFIPRYFLLDERPISLLTKDFPFDYEIRFVQSLHVLTPSLLMLFMHSVYPESIKLRIVQIFFLSTLVYFCSWILPSQVFTKIFVIYSTCATVAVLIPVGFALFEALKGKFDAAFFQGLGVFLFVLLLVFAFFGVLKAEESGFLALLSFTILALFQALILSAYYNEKMQMNLFMAKQLQESKEALAKQREELELNLHDALGGSLTDIKIFTERIRKDNPEGSWPDAIGKLDGKISDLIQNFRSQLLFMEDMELASSELFTGLHMALLRRYSDAGRELNFETSNVGQLDNITNQPKSWLHLFFLVQEICTNDLKYGIGESKWKIIRNGSDLLVQQKNKIAKMKKETASVYGKRIAERAELLGGVLKSEIIEKHLQIEIFLPKFWK